MSRVSIASEAISAAWQASLERVDAEFLVAQDEHRFPEPFVQASRRWLLSVGKVAIPMHRGARQRLGPLERELVVAPRGAEPVEGWDFITFADHPQPSMGSVAAGRALMAFADDAAAQPDVSVYALVSGGASSLCEVPVDGLSLETLTRLNRQDMAAGLSIDVFNRRRAQRSAIKGGKLAGRFGPTLLGASVVVDIPSGRPEIVGSGLLALDGLPLQSLATPRTLGQTFASELRSRGWSPQLQPPVDAPMEEVLACVALWRPTARVGAVWLAAGEIRVPVPTHALGHNGGRARHAALSLAMACKAEESVGQGRWLVFAAASDGCDGVGGAGALIGCDVLDGTIADDAQRALQNFRSGDFCADHGMMLKAHSSRTNLCDVYAVARIG